MFTQPTSFFDIMNHLQKITISDVVFHVEANCRRKLLEQIERINSRSVGLSDERLAELLLEKLKAERSDIICGKMVEEVIQKANSLKMPD